MDTQEEFPKTLTIIPDEVIYDNILPRLPVKSLTRFKTVSKTWNSLISTPQFAKSHLKFSYLSSLNFILKINESLYTLSSDHHSTLNHLVKLDLPSKPLGIENVGCCNGLICLYFYVLDNLEFSNYFVLFNPLTLQLRRINSPFHQDYPPILSKICFDYLPSLDDYKIIASDISQIGFWALSFRTQVWKYIDFPRHYPFWVESMDECTRVFVDGTLYWDISNGDDMIYICSFSLVNEQFNQETPFLIPPGLISHIDTISLCAFKGCLSIMCNLTHQSDVFVMKRQGGWEKLFSIPNMSHVIFVDFVINGKCLVVYERCIDESEGTLSQPCEHKLKLVDPSLEDIELSQGIDFEHGDVLSVHHYVESLVSPFTLV